MLDTVIDGETQGEFVARVEAHFVNQLKPGDARLPMKPILIVVNDEMTEQKKPVVYLGHIMQGDGSIGYALCESFEEAESYNAACVRNLRLLADAIANNKEKSKG